MITSKPSLWGEVDEQGRLVLSPTWTLPPLTAIACTLSSVPPPLRLSQAEPFQWAIGPCVAKLPPT